MIANSPSKLRALAAAHSTFGSPNHAAGSGTANGGKASGIGGGNGVSVVGSPKKYNPFAPSENGPGSSPRKRGLFDAQIREKEKKGGLGKGKTREGAGWGGEPVAKGPAWESIFAQGPKKKTSRAASTSSRMEVDDSEQDGATEQDDDDEMLGPSPVKPSNGRKGFKPLFDTATSLATSSQLPPPPPPPPKLWEADLASLRAAKGKSTSSKGAGINTSLASRASTPFDPFSRGIKRSQPALAFDDERPGAANDDSSTAVGGKKAAKRSRVANGGKGKAKAKGAEDMEVDDEDDANADVERGGAKKIGRVLVLEMEAGEHGDKMDRVVLRPRRPYGREDEERKAPRVDAGDGDDEDEDDYDETDRIASQGSLFYRDSADLLSSQSQSQPPSQSHPRLRSPVDSDTDLGDPDDSDADSFSASHRRQPSTSQPTLRTHHDSSIDTSLLPDELSSLLSLRSSPLRKTSQRREKDRDSRVQKLLTAPRAEGEGRKKQGLMDLEDADEEDGEGAGGEEDGGEDDDWASEPEGWKDLGEGEMDGYDDVEW